MKFADLNISRNLNIIVYEESDFLGEYCPIELQVNLENIKADSIFVYTKGAKKKSTVPKGAKRPTYEKGIPVYSLQMKDVLWKNPADAEYLDPESLVTIGHIKSQKFVKELEDIQEYKEVIYEHKIRLILHFDKHSYARRIEVLDGSKRYFELHVRFDIDYSQQHFQYVSGFMDWHKKRLTGQLIQNKITKFKDMHKRIMERSVKFIMKNICRFKKLIVQKICHNNRYNLDNYSDARSICFNGLGHMPGGLLSIVSYGKKVSPIVFFHNLRLTLNAKNTSFHNIRFKSCIVHKLKCRSIIHLDHESILLNIDSYILLLCSLFDIHDQTTYNNKRIMILHKTLRGKILQNSNDHNHILNIKDHIVPICRWQFVIPFSSQLDIHVYHKLVRLLGKDLAQYIISFAGIF